MIYTLISKDRFGGIKNIVSFTTVTDCTKTLSATVTNNPVENGTQISDGVIIESPTFDISAVITSYDIFDENRELKWDGEKFSPVSGSALTNVLPVEKLVERMFLDAEVFTLLVSERNSRATNPNIKQGSLMRSKYQEFSNCVITNFSTTDTAGTQGVFFVKLNIKQLNVAFVRRDQLEVSEQRPALVGKKQNASNKTNSSSVSVSDTSSTNTDDLALKNGDPAKVESTKKTLEDLKSDQEAKVEILKLKRQQLDTAYEKQAYTAAIQSLEQGFGATEVVGSPNGYTVKR